MSHTRSPCLVTVKIPSTHSQQFINILATDPSTFKALRRQYRTGSSSSSFSSRKQRSIKQPLASDLSMSENRKGKRVRTVHDDDHERSASPTTSIAPISGSGRKITPTKHYYYLAPPALQIQQHLDPEERLAELMELKHIKNCQDDLLELKDKIQTCQQSLDEKESLLDDIRSERKFLQSDLQKYTAMVQQIQKDLEQASQMEDQLETEFEELKETYTNLKDKEYVELKSKVDNLRIQKGLKALPNLEQEQAEQMGRYLEERRGQWREDGSGAVNNGAGPSGALLEETNSRATATSNSEATTSSRNHRTHTNNSSNGSSSRSVQKKSTTTTTASTQSNYKQTSTANSKSVSKSSRPTTTSPSPVPEPSIAHDPYQTSRSKRKGGREREGGREIDRERDKEPRKQKERDHRQQRASRRGL